MDGPAPQERQRLRRQGLRLVWIGEAWNGGEAAFGLAAAWASGSVALFAFGLDSVVELFAGLVLIRRLRVEWSARSEADADRRALRLVGWSFVGLAALIGVQGVATLVGLFPEPKASLAGVIVVAASAVAMAFLFERKTEVARQLGSDALRAEAIEALVCDVQDVLILVGLGLNAWLGWWWADPVAAFVLIPFLVREGLEAVRPSREP